MSIENNAIISKHESEGNYITVNGIKTFYIDEGAGPVVFCIHGVPTSSFLYRKVINEMESLGLRAIAIDLPGLGLSGRPEDFEYSFSNFASFCALFLADIKIEKVHLLLHDIGVPIGLSLADKKRGNIQSITVLNGMLDVEHFVKPLMMRAFEKPVLGEAELALLTPLTFPLMMNGAGVVNSDVISHDETAAYIHLLKRDDNGKAFLKIMRNFEKTAAFTQKCYGAWENSAYPVQLVWGDKDPFLPFHEHGEKFEKARPGIPVTKVEAKHFLQEEQFAIIAQKVKQIVTAAKF